MENAREIVLEALLLYDKGNEFSDKVLSDILSKYAYLEKNDRALIDRLFSGVVERRLTLDYIINQFSTVKINKQKPVIRTILRMGVYQICFMNSIPDSAAVNEAVKLAKRKKFNNLSGFVNGVLRAVTKNKDSIVFPDRNKNYVNYLSVVYSCPEWLCSHYIDEIGENETEELLKQSAERKPLYGRVNLSKTSRDDLLKKLKEEGVDAAPVDLYEGAIVIKSLDSLYSLDSFNEGLFTIQDLSSQLVVGRENIKKGDLVIDVCAAPGGKSIHALDKGASVIARDLTQRKVEKIEENANRCCFDITAQVWDALEFDESLRQKADVVIADLPCSGLGVIGRKADIKYRVTKEDLESLAALQKEILNVVYDYVKPGGTLIYSTCTINKLENEENADWIEKNLTFEKKSEYTKFIPGMIKEFDTDGFFISRFVRI